MNKEAIDTAVTAGALALGGVAQQLTAVTIGGITMEGADLAISLGLSIITASVAAASFRGAGGPGGKAYLVNFALGAVVGYALAHLLVALFSWPHITLYSLAPICSLFGAKVGRALISDDTVVDAIIEAIKKRFGGP